MEGPARFFPIVIGFFIASYYLEFGSESQQWIDDLNRTLVTVLIFGYCTSLSNHSHIF